MTLVVVLTLLFSFAPVQGFVTGMGCGRFLRLFQEHDYVFFVVFNIVVGSLWYLGASFLFRGRMTEPRREQVADFFRRFDTPLTEQELAAEGSDTYRTAGIGKLVMGFSAFLALLLFVPNTMTDRLAILFCTGFSGATGLFLYVSGTRSDAAARQGNGPSGPVG
jgi:hypothetical protein